jgi:hypothetical protein
MTRASILAIAGLLAFTSAAHAAPAILSAQARLIDPSAAGGIDILSAMVLPSINISALRGPGAGSIIESVTSTTSSQRRSTDNSSLRIQGQSGQAVSMAVPESFQVVRTGGSQALTVTTLIQGGYNLGGGLLLTSGTPQMLSVNVGGALSPLNARYLEPGDYEGVIAVVVQYN